VAHEAPRLGLHRGEPGAHRAATTLVVLVAVFLAYNANAGLPFVPTYELKSEVPTRPTSSSATTCASVAPRRRRVGHRPKAHKDGSVTAVLTMKLETTIKPLPADSTVLVRPRSALGLKYVELSKGSSAKGFQDGATIPLRQATPKPSSSTRC